MDRPTDACIRQPGRSTFLDCSLGCLLVFFSAWLIPDGGLAVERIDLSGLSSVDHKELPDHWQPLNFPSIAATTDYEVVNDMDYGPVILAQSSSGAGGIARSISVDPRKYPLLNWSWKIEDTLPDSSLGSKSGDDFPVRVMISFETKGAGHKGRQDNILCYVWATEESVDSVAVNPLHRHIMTVVAASGNTQSGVWLELSRNIVEDYVRAFSEEPGWITGVALMTDTDNTRAEARAWYGPVWLSVDNDLSPSAITER